MYGNDNYVDIFTQALLMVTCLFSSRYCNRQQGNNYGHKDCENGK